MDGPWLPDPAHPDVELDPVPASPPPGTDLDYLALLRAERERLLPEQLDDIHFTQLTLPSTNHEEKKEDDDHPQ